MICLGAWLAILAIHLATLPDRQTALMVWRRSAGFALESLVRLVGKWPAIVLSIPSIYLLSSFSPLWKDVGALGQLLAPASALNILHYPPLYCFVSRIPFFITSWIANLWVSRPLHGLFEQQEPSLEGIYLPVIVQHIALIAALAYTTLCLTSSRSVRCVLALLLASFG
jgi:hypothetical protein